MRKFIGEIMKGPDLFSVREIFVKAWTSMQKHWLKAVALILFNLVLSFLAFVLGAGIASQSIVLAIVIFAAICLIQFYFGAALLKLVVWSARDKEFTLSELFATKFRTLLSYACCALLVTLMAFGGFLLFIVPGLYVILVYGFSIVLVVDKDMGPLAALKASKHMSKPQVFNLFLYATACYGIIYVIIAPVYIVFIIGSLLSAAIVNVINPTVLALVLGIPGLILFGLVFVAYLVFLATAWFGMGHIYEKLEYRSA